MQRHWTDKAGMADTSAYDNAIARARMRVLSLSELSIEATITAIVPVTGSQKKQKPRNDRGTGKQIRNINKSQRTHQTASERILWEHATGSQKVTCLPKKGESPRHTPRT
eukprot:3808010-Pleurochrysis_carterae.AAC.1